MVRDPRGRLTNDGVQPVQPEGPSGLFPEEIAKPDTKHNAPDTDWLSMTTADPAFFLKDSGSE
jgi:hypothetical protein